MSPKSPVVFLGCKILNSLMCTSAKYDTNVKYVKAAQAHWMRKDKTKI